MKYKYGMLEGNELTLSNDELNGFKADVDLRDVSVSIIKGTSIFKVEGFSIEWMFNFDGNMNYKNKIDINDVDKEFIAIKESKNWFTKKVTTRKLIRNGWFSLKKRTPIKIQSNNLTIIEM